MFLTQRSTLLPQPCLIFTGTMNASCISMVPICLEAKGSSKTVPITIPIYVTFGDGLGSLLKAMHKGTEHVGKFPQRAQRTVVLNHRMRALTENLEKAVADENYETAASLRDEIRQLENELSKSP